MLPVGRDDPARRLRKTACPVVTPYTCREGETMFQSANYQRRGYLHEDFRLFHLRDMGV